MADMPELKRNLLILNLCRPLRTEAGAGGLTPRLALPLQHFQKIGDIPLAAATAGQRAGPARDGLHVHALLMQLPDISAPRAAAMAHHLIVLGRLTCLQRQITHGDTSLSVPSANNNAQRTGLPAYTACIASR